MDKSSRRSVGFSEEAYGQLEALAKKKGETVPEIVKESVELGILADEAGSEGGRVVIERGGKHFEVGDQ